MKHFHKRFTRLTALALSALLLASAPLAVSAQTVEEIEAKQNALAEKKADLESQLAALEEDESDKEAEQALLSEKIDTVRTQISTATENIDTLNDSITALEESLASAEAEIADTMELLKKRLCALYSAGSTVSTLEILFNAESLHDFSMRMEMVSGITRHDKMLIDQVSAYMEETAAQREELEKEKTALADEKKLLESSQAELTELEEENSALLKEIRAEKGETAEQIERTEAEENALANKMAVLIAQMQQQEAANAARPTPTPTPVPEVEPTPTPTPVPEVEPTPTPTPVPETEYDEDGNQVKDKIVSFIGVAPIDDPQYAVLVALDTPAYSQNSEKYTVHGMYISGGLMAAPTVRDIFLDILPYLGVEPDYDSEDIRGVNFTVPDVIGMDEAEAGTLLAEKTITYRIVGTGSTVTDQLPAPGSQVPGNSQIILYMGAEKQATRVEVPDFIGCSVADVNYLASNAGLYVQAKGTDRTDVYVLAAYQDIDPGTEVDRGTTITVEFSSTGASD